MRRGTLLLVLLALVVSVLPATASLVVEEQTDSQARSQMATPNTSVGAPGAQLAGAITLESTDLRTDHRQRTVAIELQRAGTPGDRAAIVVATVRETATRLDRLETEWRQLNRAYQAGRISNDRYEAERVVITADARGIERTLDRLGPVATQLPDRELEVHSSSVQAIDQLAERARALASGELGPPAPSDGDDTDDSAPEAGTTDGSSSPGDDDSSSDSSGDDSDAGTADFAPDSDDRDDRDDSDDNDDDDEADDNDEDTEDRDEETDDNADDDSESDQGSDG